MDQSQHVLDILVIPQCVGCGNSILSKPFVLVINIRRVLGAKIHGP